MRTPTKQSLLKCPFCGGPANRYSPIGMQGRSKVKILVECWSGDLHNDSQHHLFVVTLKLKAVTRRTEDITEFDWAVSHGFPIYYEVEKLPLVVDEQLEVKKQ